MTIRSKSTLFLMEQLIVIAIFAVCAAACVKILAESYLMATSTRDISIAIKAAESSAESYKAVSGDIDRTAEILGGQVVGVDGGIAAIVFYSKDWAVCEEDEAFYMLRLFGGSEHNDAATLRECELSVEKLTGEVIIAFPVAANG